MRRVVVTGVGLISPLGLDVPTSWNNLVQGRSGIGPVTRFEDAPIPSKIAGQVPFDFDCARYLSDKERDRNDLFIAFALAAAQEAIRMSGWDVHSGRDAYRTGIVIGSVFGGIPTLSETIKRFDQSDGLNLSPYFLTSCMINMAAGRVAIANGFKGPNLGVVAASSTGAHAIGEAAQHILLDNADIMIAGGSETRISPIVSAGFSATGAMCTNYNHAPERASRPFDEDRDGFVIAEGAGVMVLEELEHAIKRGVPILAELTGYGSNCDAVHPTVPCPEGKGAQRCMTMALQKSRCQAADVDYLNAHGTSTQVGDKHEMLAIRHVFDGTSGISISSTKSSTGHMQGASGAAEAIFSVLAIRDNTVPPTLNLDRPMNECKGFDMVAHHAKSKTVDCAMSNSFGFGGTNASLVFKAI